METRLKCRSIETSQVAIAIGLRPFPGDAFGKGHVTVTMILMYRTDNPAGIDQIDTAAADVHDQPVVPSGPANGETRQALERCSCSIDVIASIIPYDGYVTAETILSMSQVTGPVGSEFRSTEQAKLALQEFRRAQAEAEVRCF